MAFIPSDSIFPCQYCPLLKRMHLMCTPWVESFNTGGDGREKTYRSGKKHESLSLHYVVFA
jgi:hypothetical protein